MTQTKWRSFFTLVTLLWTTVATATPPSEEGMRKKSLQDVVRDLQMTVDGQTPQTPVMERESASKSQNLKPIKILDKIAYDCFKEPQGLSLHVFEGDLKQKSPQDMQGFKEFFKQFLSSIQLKDLNDARVKQCFETTVKSDRTNNDILTVVRDVQTAFPFLKTRSDHDTLLFMNYFIGKSFTPAQIKAIGELSLARNEMVLTDSKLTLVARNIHPLNPEEGYGLDFRICDRFRAQDPPLITARGAALSEALNRFTSWRPHLAWDDVYDICTSLAALPAHGIKDVVDNIGQDTQFFAKHENPPSLITNKSDAWSRANVEDDVSASEDYESADDQSDTASEKIAGAEGPRGVQKERLNPSVKIDTMPEHPILEPRPKTREQQEEKNAKRESGLWWLSCLTCGFCFNGCGTCK